MRKTAVATLILTLVPTLGTAQAGKDSWNDIQRMTAGSNVKVTVGKDTLVAGTFLRASDNSLIVRRGTTEMTLDRAAIRAVKAYSPATHKRSMILFGSIGLVAGVIPGSMLDALLNNETGRGGAAAPLLGALGAGIGVLAAHRSGYSTAYAAGRSSVAPLGSVASFDQLDRRIGDGNKVEVTTSNGGKIAGRVEKLGATSLTLREGSKRYELRPDDVKAITQRLPDSLANGALWGLLVGVGSGTGVSMMGADVHRHIGDSGAWLVKPALFGGIGAGVGAVIDALHKGKQVVYARPSEPRAASLLRSFNIAPVISKNQKGAALTLSF